MLRFLAIAIACMWSGFASAADEYPVKRITLVVPFAAGSATDSVARFIGDKLSKELNTVVIVETKPGAGGQIGARYVASGPTDGSVIFLGTNTTNAANVSLFVSIRPRPRAC